MNDPELPNDMYVLVELYCDEPGCDCRRVMLDVTAQSTGESHAVIAYGWESRKFYAKWMGDDAPMFIDEMKGPELNKASTQGRLAQTLFKKVKLVLKDRVYIERLKRHYKLFRAEIDKESRMQQALTERKKEKTGRNDPCPCGSGKKYKKCCLS